jgi:tetratricopeptide (TPR) repeat protein
MSRIFYCLLVVLLVACLAGALPAQELLGLNNVRIPDDAQGRQQTWALIIGINYEGRQAELTDPADRMRLPILNNAKRDAEKLSEVLRKYYSSEQNKFGYYDDEHLRTILEEAATEERINDEIERLCDPNLVQPEDSVLVYFAGHALQLDDEARRFGDAVAVLPYDVKVRNGKVFGNTVGLPYDLVSKLQKIPAKHKLLVLDCCYSGEIFEMPVHRGVGFTQRSSEADDRSDRTLQGSRAFQALASCRRSQTASDGKNDHSPFSEALIDGLKRLPARTPQDRRVWASRLLFHIRPNFPDESQRPDLRNLVGEDGEFCFHPSPAASFDEFMVAASEENLLKASVASRQGNWWFDEMPWFIPSIREKIIQEYEKAQEKTRSSTVADLIDPRAIHSVAMKFLKHEDAGLDALDKMRRDHARKLLLNHASEEFKKDLISIRDELLTHSSGEGAAVEPAPSPLRGDGRKAAETEPRLKLQTADIHFLGVVQQALGDQEGAKKAYEQAINGYNDDIKKQDRTLLHMLKALCHADYGGLLLDKVKTPQAREEAAEQFQEAQRTMLQITAPAMGSDDPPGSDSKTVDQRDRAGVFHIYALCREADAWVSVKRWSKADHCFIKALDYARSFAPEHYLTAHVHRQRAWAEMAQWRIQEAERSFAESNAILGKLFLTELDLQQAGGQGVPSTVPAERPQADEAPSVAKTQGGSKAATNSLDPFALPPAYDQSLDFASKIAYVHNLHGISMAKRFQGDTPGAADDYRRLAAIVEATFSDFQKRIVDNDLNKQLLERIANTQERLGDCNLFGNPEDYDLKEALDDYRRATHRVHLFEARDVRDLWTAKLLYKQALALSLPSSVEDTELALEMCHRADEIFGQMEIPASGANLALGELTTRIVTLIHANRLDKANDVAAEQPAACELRKAIYALRDSVGASPHRDELELCLFASKVLLEHADQQERYQVLEDANLLLSFCRIALAPYGGETHESASGQTAGSESRDYLRPYYDAVMEAKLSISRKDVKELLEIQREATQGTYYVKGRNTAPVLATYVLNDECYLLVDLPYGESQCVCLAEMYDVETIRTACNAGEPLPLPRPVDRLLETWLTSAEAARREIQPALTLWEDPVRGFKHLRIEQPGEANTIATTTEKPATGQFPFRLPAKLVLPSNLSTTQTTSTSPTAP